MIFEPYSVKHPIDQYIESVFHFKHFKPDHSIERVVPTGHIYIIFELDGMARNTFDNDTLKPNASYTKVWVSGMHKKHITISAHQDSEMFVIQFKPLGAYPFFHRKIEELNEQVVPGEELFGEEILKLRESLFQQETSLGKFQLAQKWLLSRMDYDKVPPKDFQQVIEKLLKAPCANYNEAIESYPNTQKHLIDQCKKFMGLTPKYFQRILRFHEIFQEMQKKKEIAWSSIAYQCGFSDQSHFIKEFKHFSGFNPREFIGQDYSAEDANFFPLDRGN